MSLDVYLKEVRLSIVFSNNITHNLNTMAKLAGIYEHLWRPDEIGVTTASQLIEPLTDGLERLKKHPAKYKKLNPLNGWGDYNGLVSFVEEYLNNCKENPNAIVEVSR